MHCILRVSTWVFLSDFILPEPLLKIIIVKVTFEEWNLRFF